MTRKLVFLILFCAAASFGAISSATVWDVRTGSAITNGGGYSSGGTDLSQFDNKNAAGCTSCQSTSVNISTTDAVTNNTTTVTSATANFSAALIGNTVYLTGTGTTTGWYQVASVTNATTIIVDRATGSTGGTGVTINIGGALGLVGGVTSAYVAGNTIYIKSGTYTILSAAPAAFNTAGLITAPVLIEGYASTHGDRGTMPLITSSVISQVLVTVNAASYHTFRNLKFTHTGATRGTAIQGVTASGTALTVTDCAFDGVAASFDGSSRSYVNLTFTRNSIINGKTSAAQISHSDGSMALIGWNYCYNNVGPCLSTAGSTTALFVIGNVFALSPNTGSGSAAFLDAGTTRVQVWYITGNTFANNSGDAIQSTESTGTVTMGLQGNIFYGNTGKAVNITADTGALARAKLNAYNAFGANGSNFTNWGNGIAQITLSADPFNNDASGDFSLNTTTGGGSSLRAAGYPGTWTGITNFGSSDVGAIQSPNTGGQRSYTFIQ